MGRSKDNKLCVLTRATIGFIITFLSVLYKELYRDWYKKRQFRIYGFYSKYSSTNNNIHSVFNKYVLNF